MVSWQSGLVALASLHSVTGGILCANKKGKAIKRNRKDRESEKREKITLDKGKIVAFSIHRLCFAESTSLNSKSISQRLKKKVRRE